MSTFLSDTFTGTTGTSLLAHTPDVGGAYGTIADASGAGAVLTAAGRLRPSDSNFIGTFYNAATPPSADYSVSADLVVLSSQDTQLGVIARATPASTTYYYLAYVQTGGSGEFVLSRKVNNVNTVLGNYVTTLGVGTTAIKLQCVGSRISAWVAGVERIVIANDSGGIATAGKAGLELIYNGSAAAGYHLDNLSAQTVSTFAPGTVTRGALRANTINLAATAAAGATGAVTLQWHRSEDAAFTPGSGTALAGQTSLTLADSTGERGKAYWYVLAYTDTVETVYSLPVASSLADADPLVLGVIGDSNSTALSGNTVNTPDEMGRLLGKSWGNRTVVVVNRAEGGKATADYLPGTTRYQDALTAFAAAKAATPGARLVVEINHGTNDSRDLVTKSQYAANVQAIAADLLANGIDVVVVSVSVYPNWIGISNIAARRALQYQYLQAQKEIDNGTTLRSGDETAYVYFAEHPDETPLDASVHVNDAGVRSAASLRAAGVQRALTPSTEQAVRNVPRLTVTKNSTIAAADATPAMTLTKDGEPYTPVITIVQDGGTYSLSYPYDATPGTQYDERITALVNGKTYTRTTSFTVPPLAELTDDYNAAKTAAPASAVAALGTTLADVAAKTGLIGTDAVASKGDVQAGGGTGDGDVVVNHNFGGTDALRILMAGVPIDGATVRAFSATAYSAGAAKADAQTYTGSDGRWVSPLMLDPGEYVLVITKPQVMQTLTAEITVSDAP